MERLSEERARAIAATGDVSQVRFDGSESGVLACSPEARALAHEVLEHRSRLASPVAQEAPPKYGCSQCGSSVGGFHLTTCTRTGLVGSFESVAQEAAGEREVFRAMLERRFAELTDDEVWELEEAVCGLRFVREYGEEESIASEAERRADALAILSALSAAPIPGEEGGKP